jgi:hypothetical protein
MIRVIYLDRIRNLYQYIKVYIITVKDDQPYPCNFTHTHTCVSFYLVAFFYYFIYCFYYFFNTFKFYWILIFYHSLFLFLVFSRRGVAWNILCLRLENLTMLYLILQVCYLPSLAIKFLLYIFLFLECKNN